MKALAFVMAASLFAAMAGPSFAQQSNTMPDNSASPIKKNDKKMPGAEAGSVPNATHPGTEAGAEVKEPQGSRTTETKDR